MLFNIHDIRDSSRNHEDGQKAEQYSSAFASSKVNATTREMHSAKDLLTLPHPGEAIFCYTLKQFNAFDFVDKIAETEFIEELWATTYSVSLKAVERLQKLQRSGKVGRIVLLISDSMMNRNPKVCDTINAWAKSDGNVAIIYTWNHSKFTLCKTRTANFVIEGSGNWGDNACHEQYCIVNSREVLEHRQTLFASCKKAFQINWFSA